MKSRQFLQFSIERIDIREEKVEFHKNCSIICGLVLYFKNDKRLK
jgi:hypothetical protein